VACSIFSFAPQALAHMEMSWPYPLRSPLDPAVDYSVKDYSMTSPLLADGSNFPCKGYQNDRPTVSKASYQAGQTYNMTFQGSATHGGGSCQLSLSYDNGATFRVIKSMIGGCPLSNVYDFTIPSYAPDGTALLAWTWQNLVGNREYYMNCAVVDVAGSGVSKRAAQSFNELPFIWKANIPGVNTCATTEGVIPVYPEPGPDVLYGPGANSSSPATSQPGACDAATPFGQTYKYLGDTANPSTEAFGSTAGSAPTSTVASSSVLPSSSATFTTLITSTKPQSSSSSSASALSSTTSSSSRTVTPSSSSTSLVSSAQSSMSYPNTPPVSSMSSSQTLTVTHSATTCMPDVTIIVFADATTTRTATGFPTSTATPSLTGSSVSTVLGFSTGSSSTLLVISAPTSAPSSKAGGSSTSSAAGPKITEESYATGNLATYLPCVPGTFICTSNTTWVTCDQTMYSDGTTAWVYEGSISVGPGMACFPNLSPYSSQTNQYAQQADTPSGFYRDDRYARAQPYGPCSGEGSIQCTSGGSQFMMCDHGGWILMGAVPDGTTCQNGGFVSS